MNGTREPTREERNKMLVTGIVSSLTDDEEAGDGRPEQVEREEREGAGREETKVATAAATEAIRSVTWSSIDRSLNASYPN